MVKFEFERKKSLGKTTCPKCGHEFEHIEVKRIPVTYEVTVSICHTKDHPRDKTRIYVTSTPYEVLPYGSETYFPKSIDDLKQKTKELMEKYRAKAWILGLGSDQPREVFLPKEVDKQVDEAIAYMKEYGFEPRMVM